MPLNIYRTHHISQLPGFAQLVSAVMNAGLNPSRHQTAEMLIDQLTALMDENNTGHTLGWVFKNGLDKLADPDFLMNECNVFYMGTANIPLFCEHSYIRRGGDVLSILALLKAMLSLPTLIMNGIATQNVTPFDPIASILDVKKQPKTSYTSAVTGSGIHNIAENSVFEFILPTLLMILGRTSEPTSATLNLSAHSRGCITALASADCIDQIFQSIQKMDDNALKHLSVELKNYFVNIPSHTIETALAKINQDIGQVEIRCLLFDPVEGLLPVGDRASLSLTNPTLTLNIKLFGKYICQYASVTGKVTEANIVISESERRLSFQPTIPTFHPNAFVKIHRALGTHSTIMGNMGNDNGDGQQSYQSVRNLPFIAEATQALSMLIEIRGAEFLFKDYLPYLRHHIIYNLLVFKSPGFLTTRKYLGEYLKHQMDANYVLLGSDISSFISHCDAGFKELILPDDIEPLVNLIQSCFTHDPKFRTYLLMAIESDIYRSYLANHAPKYRSQLDCWQTEMENDTTLVGSIPLALQPAVENRDVWYRRAHSVAQKLPLSRAYPFLNSSLILKLFFPQMPLLGGKELMHRFIDPYFTDVFLMPFINMHSAFVSNEAKFEVNLIFKELNEIGMRHLFAPSHASLSEVVHNQIYNLLSQLIDLHKNEVIHTALFTHLTALLVLKSAHQYHLLNYQEAANIIMLHFQDATPFHVIMACLTYHFNTSKKVLRHHTPTRSEFADICRLFRSVSALFDLLQSQYPLLLKQHLLFIYNTAAQILLNVDQILYKNGLLEYIAALNDKIALFDQHLSEMHVQQLQRQRTMFMEDVTPLAASHIVHIRQQIAALKHTLNTTILKDISEAETWDQILTCANVIQAALSALRTTRSYLPPEGTNLLENLLIVPLGQPQRYVQANVQIENYRDLFEFSFCLKHIQEQCRRLNVDLTSRPFSSPLDTILAFTGPDQSPRWSMPRSPTYIVSPGSPYASGSRHLATPDRSPLSSTQAITPRHSPIMPGAPRVRVTPPNSRRSNPGSPSNAMASL